VRNENYGKAESRRLAQWRAFVKRERKRLGTS